jgi:hypothetical protein
MRLEVIAADLLSLSLGHSESDAQGLRNEMWSRNSSSGFTVRNDVTR